MYPNRLFVRHRFDARQFLPDRNSIEAPLAPPQLFPADALKIVKTVLYRLPYAPRANDVVFVPVDIAGSRDGRPVDPGMAQLHFFRQATRRLRNHFKRTDRRV